MGLFGASPVENDVEKATDEKNTSDNWALILDVCDKAAKSPDDAKNYLRAILKRLNNSDPHISIQAATLLDACVNNSGKTFRIEVASREFENEFTKLLNKSHEKVAQKLRESLKKWAEGEFKSDPQLNLIPTLYSSLKTKGHDFSPLDAPAKKTVTLSKDPNVVQSQEEEDQIVKAIELSLKETTGSPRMSTSSTLYPAASLANSNLGNVSSMSAKEPRKVRALYDFEAAEDNELTFNSGEIIFVLDDSDPNWWKGSNQRGEGLFPANFVTADLSVEPEQFLYEKAKKIVQFKETVDVKPVEKETEDVEINEEKIDRLLHLLHEADPTNPDQDTNEMLTLEREVNCMGPLIDTELERVDRKHAQLTQLSSDLVEALGLYHTLMREPQLSSMNKIAYGYNQPAQQPSMNYNGSLPPNMGPPSILSTSLPYLQQPGAPQNIPSQYRMSRVSLPPGHMPPQGPGQPHIMPPTSSVQALPPVLQQVPHQDDPRLHHESISGQFSSPGMPSYAHVAGIPPGYPLNGPVSSQSGLQNGSNVPGSYTSTSNSHIM